MKTEFLQDISHEIQNPLTVISVGVDFIHYSIDKEGGIQDAHGALDTIKGEALRLGRMVGGMVSLATSEAQAHNRTKTDFTALLADALKTARLSIESQGNVLRVEIAPGLPPVYAEADQLARVPANLLSNAAKHTSGGEITLTAAADIMNITVRVSDTGSGIDPELLPRVFERGVSGIGSHGYGLSICKTIVEAHGGAIGIESEPGRGTTVTFTIPVYAGQREVNGHE